MVYQNSYNNNSNNRNNYDFVNIKQEPGLNSGVGGLGNNISNGDFAGVNNPLAHLSDSVNSLDPLNAMEKSLNDQVRLS